MILLTSSWGVFEDMLVDEVGVVWRFSKPLVRHRYR